MVAKNESQIGIKNRRSQPSVGSSDPLDFNILTFCSFINHKMYIKEIIDEIRSFGSNSIAIFSEPKSYPEIVQDVCKRLDIPCKNNGNYSAPARVAVIELG